MTARDAYQSDLRGRANIVWHDGDLGATVRGSTSVALAARWIRPVSRGNFLRLPLSFLRAGNVLGPLGRRALPQQNRYPTRLVASNKMLPKSGGGNRVGGSISKMAKQELLATIRDRYRASSKREKSRILDEFIAVTGHHRKHGIRLLGQSGDDGEQQPAVKKGRRIYDESVRQAVIVVWEAADRICGKRLKAALPHLVESMERHGHLDLDPGVRQRLLAASAATLDRLLQAIRTPASRRLRRRRRQSPGRNIPVRTFADWNAPPPGFLEIDLVVHHGGSWWGSMIHSLVAHRYLHRLGPRPCHCWPGSNPW